MNGNSTAFLQQRSVLSSSSWNLVSQLNLRFHLSVCRGLIQSALIVNGRSCDFVPDLVLLGDMLNDMTPQL